MFSMLREGFIMKQSTHKNLFYCQLLFVLITYLGKEMITVEFFRKENKTKDNPTRGLPLITYAFSPDF